MSSLGLKSGFGVSVLSTFIDKILGIFWQECCSRINGICWSRNI